MQTAATKHVDCADMVCLKCLGVHQDVLACQKDLLAVTNRSSGAGPPSTLPQVVTNVSSGTHKPFLSAVAFHGLAGILLFNGMWAFMWRSSLVAHMVIWKSISRYLGTQMLAS